MTIPLGQAHKQWADLKKKEAAKGTKDLDKHFTMDLGPTLDKFDAACKKRDAKKAKLYAAQLHGILDKYVSASSGLKLAAQFKTMLENIEQYVFDNLEDCEANAAKKTSAPPAKFKYIKQGNDGLCAYYALYHWTNGALDKDTFRKKALQFYKKQGVPMSDGDLADLVEDGNDPGLLQAWKLKESSLGAKKSVYIIADIAHGHFWLARNVDGVWWQYDGLKGKPVMIGSADDLKKLVGSKKVWA